MENTGKIIKVRHKNASRKVEDRNEEISTRLIDQAPKMVDRSPKCGDQAPTFKKYQIFANIKWGHVDIFQALCGCNNLWEPTWRYFSPLASEMRLTLCKISLYFKALLSLILRQSHAGGCQHILYGGNQMMGCAAKNSLLWYL
jgi:hypothetical protein